MLDFVRQFRDARRVAVPLIAVRTPDPASTIRALVGALNGDADTVPLLQWDVLTGLTGINQPGKLAAAEANGGGKPAMVTNKPSSALTACQLFGTEKFADAVVFFHQAHRYWTVDAPTVQGIWNLRDPFKGNGSILIMLTSLGATLPAELASDVLVIDEPLPSAAKLIEITKEVFAAIALPEPTEDVLTRAVDAGIGLPAFPYEQSAAMCTTKAGGLDAVQLWERKRQIIEQQKGMSVWRGGERFSDIGGCENAKFFNQKLIDARAFRLVLFLDEIEKMFAGTGTDLSGVKTELTGQFLSWMQDTGALGELFIGPPGAAKSALAKCIGNEAGVCTVAFDVAGMQSSLVGESGGNLRAGLKVAEAIGQGKVLVIGTCNKLNSLPPELRRRFKLATFFFDLPSDQRRAEIWAIYRGKFKTTGELPPDDGWTGAEIRTCCELSQMLGMTLTEASTYIVPVAISAKDDIRGLRDLATGKFIDADAPGVYQFVEQASSRPSRKMRQDIDADVLTRKGNA